MAENIAGMRAEETMVSGVSTTRSRVRMPRIGGYGLVAAALVALLVAGVAMHDRHAPHASVSVVPRAESRFIENNTTNLPNAIAPDVRPAVIPSSQRRLLEVNTMLPTGGLYPYAEDVTPLSGHPR